MFLFFYFEIYRNPVKHMVVYIFSFFSSKKLGETLGQQKQQKKKKDRQAGRQVQVCRQQKKILKKKSDVIIKKNILSTN